MRSSILAVHLLAAAVLATVNTGCGGSDPLSARPDIAAIPQEELHGAATKATLYEFRARVRKHGASAAQTDLPDILEGLEAYERQPVGSHHDTYRQIVEKLKEMQTLLGGSPSKDAVVKLAEEIGTLADSLPGEADPNPEVE